MDARTIAAVDRELDACLDGFGPEEAVERMRAEDLVSSALTLYGGAFRRMAAIAEEHDPGLRARWGECDPLGELLEFHHRFRPDSMTASGTAEDTFRRARIAVDELLDRIESDGRDARDRVARLLALVADLHDAGLRQALGDAAAGVRPELAMLDALAADRMVDAVLLAHDLHPFAAEPGVAGEVRIPVEAVRRRPRPELP